MNDRIRVMISSRVDSRVGTTPLSTIRRRIKKTLEAVTWSQQRPYDVWICEDATQDNAYSTIEECRRLIRDHDIILALYNGDAGWSAHGQAGVGICYLELSEAFNIAPARLRVIGLPLSSKPSAGDEAFRAFVNGNRLWVKPDATSGDPDTIVERACDAVAEATVALARRGALDARRGAFASGEALAWSRMDLAARRTAMLGELAVSLGFAATARSGVVRIAGEALHVVLHAVPDSFSIGPAREMLGQPFRHDHDHFTAERRRTIGPFHIVACHKNATAAQVRRVLGLDDATVVPGEFGVYVADEIAGTQMAFLAECRDAVSTRARAERLNDWLLSTAAPFVVPRAETRRRVCGALTSTN
jgi:hypothetical protein